MRTAKHHPPSCSDLRKKCKAWCCKCIFVDYYPTSEHDELYFALRKIRIVRKTPTFWTMAIPNRCKWLRRDNRCTNYYSRPQSCRLWKCEELKALETSYNHETKEDVCVAA